MFLKKVKSERKKAKNKNVCLKKVKETSQRDKSKRQVKETSQRDKSKSLKA
jgi:hypothetical protein